MAFTVTFATKNFPPNTLDKGSVDGTSVTCSPYNSVGGLEGNIIVDYNGEYEKYNYCKITPNPETVGRTIYAYIRGFTRDIGGHMTLSLEIDPLMTNKSQILNCTGILSSTTDVHGWDLMIVGDRIVQAYGLNKGKSEPTESLNFDSGHAYVGIYGEGSV